jgi:hypothetical protein
MSFPQRGLTHPARFSSLKRMVAALSADLARPLRFSEKLRITVAFAVSIALFLTVGWSVAAPTDPQEAVCLLVTIPNWPVAWVSLAALGAVASAIATAIAGAALFHVGPIAACLGLTALSCRGGTMSVLLAYHGADAAARRGLAGTLLFEMLLWAGVVAVAWAVGQLTWQWLYGAPRKAPEHERPVARPKPALLADTFAHARDGVLALLICTAVAWLVISFAIARSPSAWIERGQVLFAVGVAFLVGAIAAAQVFPRAASGWYGLSVVALAAVAYALTAMHPINRSAREYYRDLATVPPSDLFRPLPIEYLGIGIVGVLLGYWLGQRMVHARKSQRAEADT